MPRETVYDQAALYDVQVAWTGSRDIEAGDGYVQVGVKTHEGGNLLAALGVTSPNYDMLDATLGLGLRHRTGAYAHDTLTDILQALDDAGMAIIKDNGAVDFTGLWGTFNRDGINRLIRTLRRARDQAFGRDE